MPLKTKVAIAVSQAADGTLRTGPGQNELWNFNAFSGSTLISILSRFDKRCLFLPVRQPVGSLSDRIGPPTVQQPQAEHQHGHTQQLAHREPFNKESQMGVRFAKKLDKKAKNRISGEKKT